MSPHTINLRSDSPALLIEFNLPPGTHARIGASPEAEITLPLAGLAEFAEFAGVIGRTSAGQIYNADPDGENVHHIQLPGAFALSPYQFVVFNPAGPAEISPAKTHVLQPPTKKKLSRQTALALAAVVLALVTTITLIAGHQGRKPSATKPVEIPSVASAIRSDSPLTKASDPALAPPKPEALPASAKAEPAPPPATFAVATANPSPAPAKFDLETLAERVAPAVFRLEVKDEAGTQIGTGTAFAISSEGLAVTNFHVVDGGKSFTARTTQGAEFAVSGVTATDPAADLALIQLNASNLQFLELGESDSLKIGAPVAVFGAPRGLSGTLSDGILSARRTGEETTEKDPPNGGRLLQITAPVSSGSSGSPVFDSSGKVIGVAVSILPGLTSQNLNFAVPVEAVKALRRDNSAGLTDTLRRLFPSKPARPAPPTTLADPDAVFVGDPEFPVFDTAFQSADWIQGAKLGRPLAARHSKSPRAQGCFGVTLLGLGLHEQAEAAFKASLALRPESGITWGVLGDAQSAQGKTEDARQSWNRGAALSPETSWIWRSIAASHMRAGNYLDAVKPLEQLRKLDHPEFTRLVESSRSLHRHPPELQAMLHHFDNLDEPEMAAAAPSQPEELAASLVVGFLRRGQGPDVHAELADYAPTVNPYFDQGAQQRPAILKDLVTYRANWPRRTIKLVSVESARRDEPNTLEATYRLKYTASDGKKNRAGTLVQGIRYTFTGGRWLVSGIQTLERVAE